MLDNQNTGKTFCKWYQVKKTRNNFLWDFPGRKDAYANF